MYYGARYYDVALGRFTQPDSIIPRPYDPQTLNRYAYTRNNPLKYIDPTGHDIIIVGGAGASGDDPYDNPVSWAEWIMGYKGWTTVDEFAENFYSKWAGRSDAEKMKTAKETGVAIFKWDVVPGHEQFGSPLDAAYALQKQINEWGLKDVTIVGHSKGGMVETLLLKQIEMGIRDKGMFKNMILIDPPEFKDPILREVLIPDAAKTGINVVFIPGLVSCLRGGCQSEIPNAVTIGTTNFTHDIREDLAAGVFDFLNIYGDAHAKKK